MDFFISARDGCIHKQDFDYCMKNWKHIPNETIAYWNSLEHLSFQQQLREEIKKIADDTTCAIPVDVPESILSLLKDASFHSMTMLDTINHAQKYIGGNSERVLAIVKLLANHWMDSSYLTQILLSFSTEPNSTQKLTNTKYYFGVLFTMGETLVDQKVFIRFLLTKIDTVLRILVERDDARIMKEVFPYSIAKLIDRIYVRFCTGVYRIFLPDTEEYSADNPFLVFMESLLDLCKRNFRIQRLLSSILITIPSPTQEWILSSCFALAPATRDQSTVPFFPVSAYYAQHSYKATLLRIIPFESTPHQSLKFWSNWAGYLTNEMDLIPAIWETFTESFWELLLNATNSDSILTSVYAFVALATSVKVKLPDIPVKRLIKVPKALDSLSRLMESGDIYMMHISYALTHIFFDLDRVQNEVRTGNPIPRESTFDCDAEIFLKLVAFYEGTAYDLVPPLQIAMAEVMPDESQGENDGQERYDEVLDERVRRLRTAGLLPTSMLDVYHILLGDTTGSNDSETEALKHVAVLSIPIQMAVGVLVDPAHVESIGRILFEWGKDEKLDDFLTVALFELGIAYPDIISNTLVKIVSSNNHGIGDKTHMLKMTEKILIYCGTNRCISCFSMYGAHKKDEMNKFIARTEPSFFSKYLHRNRDQPLCITCPPTPDEDVIYTEEPILLGFSNQMCLDVAEIPASIAPTGAQALVQVPGASSSPAPTLPRGPPPTRRWGIRRKQNVQIVACKKKTLHTSVWAAFHHHLRAESELFLNQRSVTDGVQTHFLVQLLEFLRLLLMTYTGLASFVQNIPKEAFQLILIYGDHPNTNVRRALWSLPTELLQNMHITNEPCVLEDIGEPEYVVDLASSLLDKEKDPEVRESIMRIRKLYKSQKFRRLNIGL